MTFAALLAGSVSAFAQPATETSVDPIHPAVAAQHQSDARSVNPMAVENEAASADTQRHQNRLKEVKRQHSVGQSAADQETVKAQ